MHVIGFCRVAIGRCVEVSGDLVTHCVMHGSLLMSCVAPPQYSTWLPSVSTGGAPLLDVTHFASFNYRIVNDLFVFLWRGSEHVNKISIFHPIEVNKFLERRLQDVDKGTQQ